MSKPPLSNVGPGDRLPADATTWNAMIGAGRDHLRTRPVAGAPELPGGPTVPTVLVLVKNATGADLAEFAVVAIGGTPVVSPVDFPQDVRRLPVLNGTVPSDAADSFAVLVEPAAEDAYARAAVLGVVPVDLIVADDAHRFCEPVGTLTATLRSSATGPARILWKNGSSGTVRALVLLEGAVSFDSPLTTKGDLWGYSTTDARVPVGTNGQLLKSDSTEALGVKWWSLPPTTKGDLFTFDSTYARLPVGTNGQFLTADSTATTGLKWFGSLVATTATVNGDPASYLSQYAADTLTGANDPRFQQFTIADQQGTSPPSPRTGWSAYTDAGNSYGVSMYADGDSSKRATGVNEVYKLYDGASAVSKTVPVTASAGALLVTYPSGFNVVYNGTVTFNGTVTGAVTGSGTTGKLPKFSGGSALTDSLVSESGSTVNVNGTLTVATLVSCPSIDATGGFKNNGVAGASGTDALGNVFANGIVTTVAGTVGTARTALGLGTGDSPQFTAINLGHASDTTITRVSAGVIAVEGVTVLTTGTGQALDATLTALAAYNTNGLLTQTAADTFAGRTLTGTAGQITVANGDGVAGNPTLSLPADVLIPTVITAPNTGLHLLDTDASHDLILKPGSNLTADRTLTVTTGDANRTITLSADTTLSGTNTGDQTITLTGDVTGSGTGSFAATIAANAVTYAKIQNVVANNRILGNRTGAGSPVEEMTVAQVLGMAGTGVGQILYYSSASGWTVRSIGAANTLCYAKDSGGGVIEPDWLAISDAAFAASDTARGAIEIAVQSEMETATDTVRAVVPGRLKYHPGVAKAWVHFDASSGTPTINDSYNVSSITDGGVGVFTINLTTAFSSTNFVVAGAHSTPGTTNGQVLIERAGRTSSAYPLTCNSIAATPYDPSRVMVAFFGDQ